jgi:hypothetical protein
MNASLLIGLIEHPLLIFSSGADYFTLTDINKAAQLIGTPCRKIVPVIIFIYDIYSGKTSAVLNQFVIVGKEGVTIINSIRKKILTPSLHLLHVLRTIP